MRFSKVLLILGIVALASVFVMNVSFAANSENLNIYKGSFSSSSDKKISNVEQVSSFKNNYSEEYLKISIKKNYQNKYKIKSATLKYSVIDNKTYKVINVIYKNYTGKNKNFLKISPLNNDSLSLEKITINYYTKGKINKETFYPYYADNLTIVEYLNGKKSNAKSVQKGNFKITQFGNIPVMKYQEIKIVTKNKKYKIKAVKLTLTTIKGKISYKSFKGYKKNSLRIQLYNNKLVQEIKVYYY